MTDEEKIKFVAPITALSFEARDAGHKELFAALSWLGGAIMIGRLDIADADARRHIHEHIGTLKQMKDATAPKCEL